MYNNSFHNYSDDQAISYFSEKYGPGGHQFMPTSHQGTNYYSPGTQQPSSMYSTQPPPLSRHQSYPTPDPRLIAQQTNQTLTALASARRFSPEYTKDPCYTPPTRDINSRNYSYYDVQTAHYPLGNGKSSDPHGGRPAYGQSHPISTPPAPSMSNASSKMTDGHACSYCGKTFGRPSALKIHLAIHTGEKAFVCPEAGCHRSFSVRSNMSRHIRNVHQIWPDGHEEAQNFRDDAE